MSNCFIPGARGGNTKLDKSLMGNWTQEKSPSRGYTLETVYWLKISRDKVQRQELGDINTLGINWGEEKGVEA